MKVFVLAGGSGTRLWPLSRRSFPKQFIRIGDGSSLLRQTVDRFDGAAAIDDVIVITNADYQFFVRDELRGVRHMVLEPVARNTAPAIALGMKYCRERLKSAGDEVIFLSPSDHIIRPASAFRKYVARAQKLAEAGYIVTFGISPDRPETGYGYIKAGGKLSRHAGVFTAERFTEKPDARTAAGYLRTGGYYWNSGMFVFTLDTMERELARHAPAVAASLKLRYDGMLKKFSSMPDISIDYAVMEKSDRVVVLPIDLYWNDVGSWDALYDVLEKDADGNAVHDGSVIAIDTKKTLIIGGKRLIATIGIEDCVIVETPDATLIAKRGKAQKVKDVVARLKTAGRPEAAEHVTTHRPWGSYTVLEEGERYKIKHIVVNPKEKLSLQMHNYRSEHWVVVKGRARVMIGRKTLFLKENESAFVPMKAKHRLENPGTVPLEIIEVQNGNYVGEDDIVRLDDKYNRI